MDLTVEVTALKDLLTTSSSIVILLPDTSSRDAIAAALSLYLSLTQLSKIVTIASPKPPTVGLSYLVGVNKITQSLGNKNFVVSLDYQEGAIEKVSYNIEGNKFNLVIEPKTGAPLLSSKNVKYNYSGVSADLVITLEAVTKESLGAFYTQNQTLFNEKPVLVVDNRVTNTQYGKINIVRPAASLSEIVVHLLKVAEMPIDADIASNLYDGIIFGSRMFASPAVNADTFEAAAWVLRFGARKPISASREETPRQEFAMSKSPELPQTPPEWLKPKIYKGSTLL